jgi:hypothetical protein
LLLTAVASLPLVTHGRLAEGGVPASKGRGVKAEGGGKAPASKRAPAFVGEAPAKFKASGRKATSAAPLAFGCANPTPNINFDQIVGGALEPGDCASPVDGSYYDAYSFEGLAGQQIVITMTAVSPTDPGLFDPYLYLLRPGETTLDDLTIQDDDGAGYPNPRIKVTLSQSGTYTIIANTFGASQTGSYTLSLAGGAVCTPAATPIVPNGLPASGSLSGSDCALDDGSYYDVYTFSGTAGQRVAVSMAPSRSTPFDTYLFLIGPDGDELARDDNGGGGTNSRVPANTTEYARLPQTGTYRIIANSLNPGVSGNYFVTLSAAAEACPSAPVAREETKNGSLATGDCRLPFDGSFIDVYTFSGTAGQTFSIELNSADFNAYLLLLDPSGSELAGNDNGGAGGAGGQNTNARIPALSADPNAPASITLPTTGTYTIYANSNSAGQTGAYTLTVNASLVCTMTLTASSRAVTAAGGQFTDGFTREAGCAAPDVTTAAPWITVGAASIGADGAGTFGYAAAANAGGARSGTISVGGQTFTVNQSAAAYAISGRLTAGASALAGATVTLSGSQSGSTTTDANGGYSFNVAGGGSYTVTPSKLNYSFAPGSQTFNNLTASQTADFAGTLATFNVTGRVASANNAALAGATVTLTGSQSAATTTDASGNYSFASLPAGGNYTVTPSKTNYNFTPPSRAFVNLAANQTGDFTAALNLHSISGRVADAGNVGLAGATVTLSGSQSAVTTTDAGGNYSFASLPAGGSYTVSPSKSHYTFAPPSRAFTNLGANQTADFVSTLDRHTISGRVTLAGGGALANVTVALSGGQTGSTTTDAAGNYSFANLPAGASYTVAPSLANHTFAPPSRAFDDLGANQTGDFSGTLNDYTISGRVTVGTAPLPGVTVTLSGGQSASAQTDAGGNYSFTVPAGAAYTVTPAKTHYTFAPSSQTFGNIGGNRTADFAAMLNRHAIGGRVTLGAAGLPGVTVTLSGTQSAATTTDANGDYAFTNLPAGGDYTVTPAKTHYNFAPASRTYTNLGANQTGDFAAALNLHSISGRVADANNTGLAGSAVTLTGTQSGSTTTDVNGNFSFPSLPAGGSYTVNVSLFSHTLSPSSSTFSDLGQDQFVAVLATFTTYTISGRVTVKGGGLAGATVTLSGTQSGSVLTATDGSYSFTVGAFGDYTVAVAKSSYSFAPRGVSFTNVGANQIANFKATAKRRPPFIVP